MKRKHNLAFHFVMLLFIMVATILVFYKALMHLRTQIDDIKISSVYRVKQIGEDYLMLLASNEEVISEHIKASQAGLKKDLLETGKSSWIDIDSKAAAYEMDLIIIADTEGKVLNSTDIKLKGEQLKKILPGFDSTLEMVEQKDGFFIDRIGLLTQDQILYKTAWYKSDGKLLIYAVDAAEYLQKHNSETFAQYLLGGYFKNLTGSIMMVKEIDLCFDNDSYFYSSTGGSLSNLYTHTQLYTSIESQIINSYESVLVPLRLTDSSETNRMFLQVKFDDDMVRQISLNLIFRALFGFIVLALVIYLIVYFFFRSMQKDKEDLMLEVLEAIRTRKFHKSILEKEKVSQAIVDSVCAVAELPQSSKTVIKEIKPDPETLELVKELRKQVENSNEEIKILTEELRDAQELSERMRRNDPVTGLPNREVMLEHLDYESARADREKKEFSLLIIKLSNLSKLNNAYGHNFADYVINKTGSKLRSTLRRQDRIGRWERDEFLLILPNTNSTGIRQLIAKLAEMIENIEYVHEDSSVKLEILFGAVLYKPGMKSDNCLRQGQVAIQEAQHSGTHTVIE